MLIYILIGVAVVAVLFVIVVAMQPSTFRISRSVKIAAPPSAAFVHVNDFHNWLAWSPWEKLDPLMKRTYEGPAAGTGAVYSWVGNKHVGEGRCTITESRPGELIRMRLEFFKPFKATNEAEFAFKPEGNQSSVAWNMTGKRNFMFKAMGLLMNMDKMCGAQFEQGLANLKAVVETDQAEQRRDTKLAAANA
jgi:hypothetical protein